MNEGSEQATPTTWASEKRPGAAGAMGALFSRVAGKSTAPEEGTAFVSEVESIPCVIATPGASRAHPSAEHEPSASARLTAQQPNFGSCARAS